MCIRDRDASRVPDLFFKADIACVILSHFSNLQRYSFTLTILQKELYEKPDSVRWCEYIRHHNHSVQNHQNHLHRKEQDVYKRQGEKGIKILAPAPYKVQEEREKLDPATQKPVLDKKMAQPTIGSYSQHTVTNRSKTIEIPMIFWRFLRMSVAPLFTDNPP